MEDVICSKCELRTKVEKLQKRIDLEHSRNEEKEKVDG